MEFPAPCAAQEITLLAGSISSANSWPRSYAWSFDYRQPLPGPFSLTTSYLNQGHFPGHHRDGVAAEVWAHTDLLDGRLRLAVGLGPFRYYDTTVAAHGGGYSDAHGLAMLYSAGATWRPAGSRWFGELRLDSTSPSNSIATTSVSLGVGYRLDHDTWSRSYSERESAHDESEVTLFYGKTVVNSFNSQEAQAKAAEFRERFTNRLRASVAFINEGDARLIRRSGGVVEGWLEPSFFEGRYTLGIGAGVYAAIDKYHPTPGRHVSAILTMTMSYRVLDRADLRFNWHRIVTDYNRDTDIVLLGLGYRF